MIASAMATKPYYGVSDRYDFINTMQVVDSIQKEGWYCVEEMESKTRAVGRQGFQKHAMKFEHNNLPNMPGMKWRVLIINSHDRSFTFRFELGLFRYVCCNGLVIGNQLESMNIKHIKGSDKNILGNLEATVKSIPQVSETINQMRQVELIKDEQHVYVDAINQLVKTPYNSELVLKSRRPSDESPTIFNTYNVVQENIMKGHGNRRPIRAIDKDIKLNKALYRLADEMLKLKTKGK